MNKLGIYTCTLLCFILASHSWAQQDVVQYVDPFIGTENSGNVFPGPSLPFGMVRLSPDGRMTTGKSPNNNSGYVSKSPVYGFSHTHVSGTGGGAKYGNILLMPIVGEVDLKQHGSPISNEVAKAGFYSVKLDKYNIKVELSASHSVGLHRYTFPKTDQAKILIDAASFLVKGSTVQKLVNSSIKVISNKEIMGSATVAGGWNEGAPYTVYFYATFSKPAVTIETVKNEVVTTDKSIEVSNDKNPIACGAVLNYQTKEGEQLLAKVGISFISTAKAQQNLKEVANNTFDQIAANASNIWNGLLQRIKIEGGTAVQKKQFYTALYHVMLMPSNRTGENPLWKSTEPYYDDYYAIWDTYRASNPLITLIDQKRQEDIVRSLIDIYRHEGYMPDARSGNDNGLIQSGTNSDILIADAYVKGLKNIDYAKAYEAMVKNAEVEPSKPKKEGREGIDLYNKLGYVPSDISIAGSRTLEYANNDFAIATLAKGLGKSADVVKYLKKASNWQNIWRSTTESHGAKGFVWSKKEDGIWDEDFDVFKRGTFKGYLYEGNSWTYSLYVPQDVKKLIQFSGGKDAFIKRLDTFFINKYYNVNNEPGFLTPSLYTWAGRPDKVAETVNSIRNVHYNITRGGLPGNDDSGAMSAWYAMHAMGFYPNAGQDVYLITAPLFKKVTIQLYGNKSFVINAANVSDKNIYVQSAKLNGQTLNRAWFSHTEIKNGAVLDLEMGNQPSRWGSENPPPSLSDKD